MKRIPEFVHKATSDLRHQEMMRLHRRLSVSQQSRKFKKKGIIEFNSKSLMEDWKDKDDSPLMLTYMGKMLSNGQYNTGVFKMILLVNDNPRFLDLFVRNGGIPTILEFLKICNSYVKIAAARMVKTLISFPPNKKNTWFSQTILSRIISMLNSRHSKIVREVLEIISDESLPTHITNGLIAHGAVKHLSTLLAKLLDSPMLYIADNYISMFLFEAIISTQRLCLHSEKAVNQPLEPLDEFFLLIPLLKRVILLDVNPDCNDIYCSILTKVGEVLLFILSNLSNLTKRLIRVDPSLSRRLSYLIQRENASVVKMGYLLLQNLVSDEVSIQTLCKHGLLAALESGLADKRRQSQACQIIAALIINWKTVDMILFETNLIRPLANIIHNGGNDFEEPASVAVSIMATAVSRHPSQLGVVVDHFDCIKYMCDYLPSVRVGRNCLLALGFIVYSGIVTGRLHAYQAEIRRFGGEDKLTELLASEDVLIQKIALYILKAL